MFPSNYCKLYQDLAILNEEARSIFRLLLDLYCIIDLIVALAVSGEVILMAVVIIKVVKIIKAIKTIMVIKVIMVIKTTKATMVIRVVKAVGDC